MAKSSGSTFKFDTSAIGRMGDKMTQRFARNDKVLQSRMKQATNMVWRIAHQKRPMISKAQMKAQGRTSRVSDPNATLGVPVQTGALQASIQQSVTGSGGRLVGKIWCKGVGYANFIEYGTSKMPARPFMRPAVALTKEAIKRMFDLKIDSNL
jgi:HK97 gp10 family phage protein